MNKTILAMLLTAITTSAWWAVALWGDTDGPLSFVASSLSIGQILWIGAETIETIKRG